MIAKRSKSEQTVKSVFHPALPLPPMSKVSKFVDDIAADPKKGIIWAILLVIVIVAIYFAWNKLKDIFTDLGNTIGSVKDNPVESNNLTHQGAWYKNAANTLFTAMDGWGTDEDAIDGVIAQIYNQDDWNKLVREYGTRELSQPWWQSPLSGTSSQRLQQQTHQRNKQYTNGTRHNLGIIA